MYLKHPTSHCQNSTNPNKSCLLLGLTNHKNHIEKLSILQTRWLLVHEHTAEILSQLIVALELVTHRVEQR